MNKTSGGLSFCGVLSLIFITLKLVNVITWSWLWVLAPIWLPIVVVLLLIICALIATIFK